MTHSDIDIDQIRSQLVQRRKDILALRRSADERWQRLQAPAIESEEVGTRYSMAQGLENLETRSRREVEQIDRALSRMTDGRFGECEDCGEPISPRRLRVIPWTPRCKRCAERREEVSSGAGPYRSAQQPIVTGAAGELTDAEIVAAIEDGLQRDGRVETEELQISSKGGIVHLDGVLPGEKSRRILHEMIENVLGFKETEDRIAIDRTLWEQRQRTRKPPGCPQKAEDEAMMQGEESETQVNASKADGTPLTPPDTLSPEKNR